MTRLQLILLVGLLFSLSGFSSAHAAGGTCGPAMLTVAGCPLMEVDGAGDPALVSHTFPLPIGEIQIPKKVYFFSGPLCIAESSIRTTMQSLYGVFSDAFLKPFTAALMLYVCIYAISFMYGLVNPKDFALRLLKLAFVYVLVTDSCTFYNYLYGGFIGVSNDLIQIMGEVNAPTPPANAGEAQKRLYESLDDLFQNVVGVEGLVGLGIFMLSSLTSNAQGIPSALLATLGIGSMAIAMMRAMVTLGIAMAGIAFFLLFTPMFLSFYLFENTKRFFDSWLSMLISLTLQPVIIIAFLVMMKAVLNSASAAPTTAQQMNINKVISEAVKGISSYRFEPEMAGSRPTFNVYQPNPDLMASLGITIDADDTPLEIQTKFFLKIAPNLLFWFVMNMIMAAFIKEVPSLAHRLGGYVAGPSIGGKGLMLPGVDGTSGQITSILKSSMLRNAGVRNAGIAGLSIATAYGVKNMVSDGTQARDNNIANQAADGEADRKGGITRAGTLGELLGMDKTTRDGMRAEGIGEKEAASREGPNVVGIGEKEGAARIDTTAASMKAANQNAQKGAEMLSIAGIKIKPPRLSEKPTIIRDINIKVQDIDIAAMGDKKTTYLLNNQKIEVKKEEEEAFLRQQIAQIDKDLGKTGVMGDRAQQEVAASLTLRERLMMRLSRVNSKNTLAAAEKAEERQRLMTELGVVSSENQTIAAMQKQYEELENEIELKKTLLEAAKAEKKTQKTKEDIAKISFEIADLEQQRTAIRSTATIIPELVEQSDIQSIKKLADQKEMQPFKEDLDKLHDSMLRLDVVMAHKNTTAEMAKTAEDLRLEKISPAEIKDVAKQINVIMQQPATPKTAEQIDKLLAQLKGSSNAAKYKKAIEELEKLQTAQQTQVFERRKGIDGNDVSGKIVEKTPDKEAVGSLDNFAKAMRENARTSLADYQAANSQDTRVGEMMAMLEKLDNRNKIGASSEKGGAFTDAEVDKLLAQRGNEQPQLPVAEDDVDSHHLPEHMRKHNMNSIHSRKSQKFGEQNELSDAEIEALRVQEQIELQQEMDEEKLAVDEAWKKAEEETSLAANEDQQSREYAAENFENVQPQLAQVEQEATPLQDELAVTEQKTEYVAQNEEVSATSEEQQRVVDVAPADSSPEAGVTESNVIAETEPQNEYIPRVEIAENKSEEIPPTTNDPEIKVASADTPQATQEITVIEQRTDDVAPRATENITPEEPEAEVAAIDQQPATADALPEELAVAGVTTEQYVAEATTTTEPETEVSEKIEIAESTPKENASEAMVATSAEEPAEPVVIASNDTPDEEQTTAETEVTFVDSQATTTDDDDAAKTEIATVDQEPTTDEELAVADITTIEPEAMPETEINDNVEIAESTPKENAEEDQKSSPQIDNDEQLASNEKSEQTNTDNMVAASEESTESSSKNEDSEQSDNKTNKSDTDNIA